MPAGLTNNALLLGITEMVNRTFQARLHYSDPGDAGTANPISADHAYEHVTIAKGGIVREGTTGARFSNQNAISWAAASGGSWGSDATTAAAVTWVTLWYDADDPDNVNSALFDTLFGSWQLNLARRIDDGDTFIIRANGMDVVSTLT